MDLRRNHIYAIKTKHDEQNHFFNLLNKFAMSSNTQSHIMARFQPYIFLLCCAKESCFQMLRSFVITKTPPTAQAFAVGGVLWWTFQCPSVGCRGTPNKTRKTAFAPNGKRIYVFFTKRRK